MGQEVDVTIRRAKDIADWKPLTFRSGIPDLSQRVDEFAWGYLEEKFPSGKNRPKP